MNRVIHRCRLILGVFAIVGSVMTGQVFAQAINVEAAKQEGKVIVYGAQVPQAMKPLHAAFEKKYWNFDRILERFVDPGFRTGADRMAGR